ncbi:hypothetical protein RB195_000402 [Necator americanus]|uniref:Neurotransmitter-gated ion-channel ligand-binding domain-containing protein n=1 Tax=Necator americanus TaxID=51031 RepID=A0ABR1DCK7_NECAM
MLRVTVFWLALIPNYALTSCPFVDRDDYLHEQARLYKALLKDYDPRLSAVSMQTLNSSVELNPGLPRYEAWITLVFMKMIQVVEPEQKVDFIFEYAIDWKDERLRWNASEYCGIERIYLATTDVWIPEVTIIDAHSSQDYREDYKKFVWLNSSGYANYFVPTLTSTICTIKVRDFPFDHQECYIKTMAQSFSAWEYRIRAVLKNTLFENSSAIEDMGNGEWQIKNVSVKSKFADNGDEYATEMNIFVITMKRNASFYITMIIMPSFIINVLSIFGVFLRTADSMGKLGIALTNLMSLTFILGILATALPKTKDLPRIAIFVMLNLCIMVLALVTTLLLTHFKHYIDGDPEVADSTGEKRKRKDGKLFRLAHIGSFVLLEIANLVNFIILVV